MALFGSIVLCAGSLAWAQASDRSHELRALADKLRLKPEDLRPTPAAGWYEVTSAQSTGFVSADGRYLIRGDLYEIASQVNLSDARRRELRLALLAQIQDKDAIVFGNENAKHTVTVFTDVDCGYCRKLHSEMREYNALGIRVKYLAYPRSGPNTPSWQTMEHVWCAKDRGDALTRAKSDQPVEARSCDAAAAVKAEYRLGVELGIGGTPAIVLDDGELLGGYLPPDRLAAYIQNRRSKSPAPRPTSAAR